MMRHSTDVFISGGGIAGLTAAAALAHSGFSVILADPAAAALTADADGSDLRSTAFLQPARMLLENCGLWSALAPYATPLQTLRVIDSVGNPPEIRADRAFEAGELGDQPFGWNLPNWLTRKVMVEYLSENSSVDLNFGDGFKSMLARESEALVTLTSGKTLKARLVIGADGRASPVREAAGIELSVTRYGQKALACVLSHEKPHDCVSTEIYESGGAFTLVPLPDHDDRHCSALVWMNAGPRALQLLNMNARGFSEAATIRSCGVLGELHLEGERRIWPVVTQRALHLTAERTALIAEAAHVLPPIGAQGLNTSLQDVAHLVVLACETPDALGSRVMLDRYAKARERDIRARATVIDLFNRICQSSGGPLLQLRELGLKAVHDIQPLRRQVMRAGLGK